MLIWILLALVVAAYVYEDAKKRDLSNNKWAKTPGNWALGVFFLMIVFLPLYIMNRGPEKGDLRPVESFCGNCGARLTQVNGTCTVCGAKLITSHNQ